MEELLVVNTEGNAQNPNVHAERMDYKALAITNTVQEHVGSDENEEMQEDDS